MMGGRSSVGQTYVLDGSTSKSANTTVDVRSLKKVIVLEGRTANTSDGHQKSRKDNRTCLDARCHMKSNRLCWTMYLTMVLVSTDVEIKAEYLVDQAEVFAQSFQKNFD